MQTSNKKEKVFLFEERWIQLGAIVFWAAYWLFNAIDKVASGSTYWVGKVRGEKMFQYFSSINLGEWWLVNTSLTIIGILELLAGVLFLIALVFLLTKKTFLAHRFFFWGTATGMVIFSGFIMFDIVVGDRMELWEHTTYWLTIMMSWVVYSYAHKFVRGV